MSSLPTLTQANYYSPEADAYVSNSQAKGWLKCQRGAFARYVEHDPRAADPPREAFAAGSILDALLLDHDDIPRVEAEHRSFLFNKPKKPTKKEPNPEAPRSALYLKMIELADFVKSQAWVMEIMERSQKQAIYTFEVDGVACKARFDLLDLEMGYIWDLKAMADLAETIWCPDRHRRVHWVVAYEYKRQLGVYQEAARQNLAYAHKLDVGLIAVQKPTPTKPTPAIHALYWDDRNMYEIDAAFAEFRHAVRKVATWREMDPADLARCDDCEYCRKTAGPRFELYTGD